MIKFKKNKNKQKHKIYQDNYKLWTNGRLFSLILLGVSILMFVLSIVELPFFAIFPGYTFGLLLGYYSYIFYLVVIYYAVCKLFNLKVYLVKLISKVKTFHYSWLSFFILILGLIILIETSLYISKGGAIFPGLEAWNNNFNNWWESFTIKNNSIEPNINNSGVIITLIISFLFSISGSIVSIFLSFLLIAYFIFYSLFSSPVQKFLNNKKAKIQKEIERKDHESKIVNLSFGDKNKDSVVNLEIKVTKPKEIINPKNKIKEVEEILDLESDDTIPFDNPFDEQDDFLVVEKNTDGSKVNSKNEANMETEFIFNNYVPEKPQIPDTYQITKDFATGIKEVKKIKNKK